MTGYDTTAYINPVSRWPGWYDVMAVVAWVPNDPAGDLIGPLRGAFLDATSIGGPVALGDGVMSILDELGVPAGCRSTTAVVALAEAITESLEAGPHASAPYGDGWLTVDLTAWESDDDAEPGFAF